MLRFHGRNVITEYLFPGKGTGFISLSFQGPACVE